MKSSYLIIFLILLVSCDNKDIEPVYNDTQFLVMEPFHDLISAINVYKSLHNDLPSNFKSLTELSREEWIKACEVKMQSRDTAIIGDISVFDKEKSTLEKTSNGLKVNFYMNDNEIYDTNYEEALYSNDFDSRFLVKFHVFMRMIEGEGILELNDDSSRVANLNILHLQAELSPQSPTTASIGKPKVIQINNLDNYVLENLEPICIEF